jgi:hypothetical protein
MLQQMKNKVSMGWDSKQSKVQLPVVGPQLNCTEKKEAKEQEKIAGVKTAQVEEREVYDNKKPFEQHAATGSKVDADARSTDGPNRLKQNRVTRWIDLALMGSING